jgi:hypothetical protein
VNVRHGEIRPTETARRGLLPLRRDVLRAMRLQLQTLDSDSRGNGEPSPCT